MGRSNASTSTSGFARKDFLRTRSSRVRGTSASGGVFFTRASSDPSANASGGVYCAVSRARVPLSPDSSDMSSPEDVYTRSCESLPVPIKSFTQVESPEPLSLASETPTVFHGRELPAGRQDGLVGHALWLRKEAARRGYAWRQQ